MASTTTISAAIARAQLGSLLDRVARKKARFVITKGGKPAAALLSVTDLDDMLEELDPEFQKSLTIAAQEHRSGKATSLREYLRQRRAPRRSR